MICNKGVFFFFFLNGCWLSTIAFFFGLQGFIGSTVEEVTGNRVREGERRAAKGPRLGVEPGSAAARTKPLHMDARSTN